MKTNPMKTTQLIINVMLILAVLFLAYRQYRQEKRPPESTTTIATLAASNQPVIVYINTDSLLENYPYYETLKKQFEKKHDSLDRLMTNRMKALENEIKTYQDKATVMTEEQRLQEEERLLKKQQDLSKMRQSLLNDLAEEEDRIMNDIYKNLSMILKEYNQTRGYHFILGYQKGSGILFAHDSLDITKEIIDMLRQTEK
jgi:outer membrane protein